MVKKNVEHPADKSITANNSCLIPVFAFGFALSLFLAIAFSLCIVFYFLFPEAVNNHAALQMILPDLKMLSWKSYLIGLVQSFAFGWYIAFVFGPIYNFFVIRLR